MKPNGSEFLDFMVCTDFMFTISPNSENKFLELCKAVD